MAILALSPRSDGDDEERGAGKDDRNQRESRTGLPKRVRRDGAERHSHNEEEQRGQKGGRSSGSNDSAEKRIRIGLMRTASADDI